MRAIAVFPDGSKVVTSGGGHDEKLLRVWDLRSAEPVLELSGHVNAVQAVTVTPDGSRIVSCSQSGTIIWDAGTGAELIRARHYHQVRTATLSATGDTTAFVDLAGRIWRSTDPSRQDFHRLDQPMPAHSGASAIAVTADGEQLAYVGTEPSVAVIDPFAGLRTMPIPPGDGRVVAISPDGTRVAVGAESVQLWDTVANTIVELAGWSGHANAIAFTGAAPRVIVGGFDGEIHVWDGNGDGATRLDGHGSQITALAASPDGTKLFSGARDGTIRLWDLDSGDEIDVRRFPRPEPASDRESARDLLGFTDDVAGMATLVTDRDTRSPLAIALLGKWGSGKSSFVRQLHDRVETMTGRARRDPGRGTVLASVRQIRFDAWHYNDDELWVGMVEHLFAGLADPEPTDEALAKRDALSRELGHLETLADPTSKPGQRALARLRLAAGQLRRWHVYLALTGATVAVVAVVLGVTLSWIYATAAAIAAVLGTVWPAVLSVADGWRRVRSYAGQRNEKLDAQIRRAETELSKIDPKQGLKRTVEEVRSGKYEQYRGLFGRVHDDLRRISDNAEQAVAEWRQHGSRGEPPLQRIVLYIDDLDRCSPRKVVEVLTAVHLLLALPLFVVVVAVDPRWLLNCLRQYQSELFGDDIGGAAVATPIDYLDKIFQIVFALRPMGYSGHLIAELVPTNAAEPASPSDEPATGTPPSPDRPASKTTGPGRDGDDQRRPKAAHSGPSRQPRPEPLRFTAAEKALIEALTLQLRAVLDTPRAVKRLVNLYRLVRAGIPPGEVGEFVDPRGGGDYRAVLILLAVAVATPVQARTLISALQKNRDDTEFSALLERMAADCPVAERAIWERLLTILRQEDPEPSNLGTYRRWAGTIARFSFETWDLTAPRDHDGELGG